jgi:hypothetical protein
VDFRRTRTQGFIAENEGVFLSLNRTRTHWQDFATENGKVFFPMRTRTQDFLTKNYRFSIGELVPKIL